MDVVVRIAMGDDAVGVQFKYSQLTPPRSIQRSELIDILDAFHRTSTHSGALKLVEFVLVSNRTLRRLRQSLYSDSLPSLA